MLFNSYEFIFAFLPVSFLVYFFLNSRRLVELSKGWLVFCSLFFYAWWDYAYLPLITSSILINYVIGNTLTSDSDANLGVPKKVLLIIGIAINLCFLGFYKYTDFFLSNLSQVLDFVHDPLGLVLPLAISFFTFQQIAYLVEREMS